MKLSAKEYYETKLKNSSALKMSPDMGTLNALSAIHMEDLEKAAMDGLRSYEGIPRTYCMCARTNELVTELLAIYPEELRQEVQQVYIVKSFDYRANAFAHVRTGDYQGYLISYWEGLNILFHMTAILYAEYYDIQDDLICARNGKTKISKSSHEEKRERHMRNIESFILFVDSARRGGFDMRLTPNIDFSTADDSLWAQFFNGCIAFAVAHEIGHHILNHTAPSPGSAIRAFVSLPENWRSDSEDHRMEFEADLFAAKSLCRLKGTSQLYKPYIMYVSPLLALGSLGMLMGNETTDSTTHPAISRRYSNVAQYLDTENSAGYSRQILNAFMWNMFGNLAQNDNIKHWWDI